MFSWKRVVGQDAIFQFDKFLASTQDFRGSILFSCIMSLSWRIQYFHKFWLRGECSSLTSVSPFQVAWLWTFWECHVAISYIFIYPGWWSMNFWLFSLCPPFNFTHQAAMFQPKRLSWREVSVGQGVNFHSVDWFCHFFLIRKPS